MAGITTKFQSFPVISKLSTSLLSSSCLGFNGGIKRYVIWLAEFWYTAILILNSKLINQFGAVDGYNLIA